MKSLMLLRTMKEPHVTANMPALIFAWFMFTALSGCSVTGYVIGTWIDGVGEPKAKMSEIKKGTAIHIVTRDGLRFTTSYAGMTTLPAKVYAQKYHKAREQHPILPDLQDTIALRLAVSGQSKQQSGIFSGFDYDQVLFRPLGKTSPDHVSLKSFQGIVDMDGRILYTHVVRKMISEGSIPLMMPCTSPTNRLPRYFFG